MREGFLAAHVAAGVHQLERPLLPDHRGQRHRDAEALVEAEPGEVAAEAGLGRGDAEVGREREAEPAADGRALHRGDDRLAVREDAGGLRRRGGPVLSRRSLPLRSAPAQKFLPSEQSTRARHSGVVVEAEDGVGERGDDLEVEPVVRRPVDLDRRDVVDERRR